MDLTPDTTASPISKLPVDIFDLILEHTYSTRKTPTDFPYLSGIDWQRRLFVIRRCSLVSKGWRERSQCKLWEEVRLWDDASAKLWIKSKGTLRMQGVIRKLSITDLGRSTVRKVIEKSAGVRELELYLEEGFDVDLLGSESLSDLKKLVLPAHAQSIAVASEVEKYNRIPRVLKWAHRKPTPLPLISFSLSHLWVITNRGYNTTEGDFPEAVLRSLLDTSVSTLQSLILKGPPHPTTITISNILNSHPSLPILAKFEINEELLSDTWFSTLKKAPHLQELHFHGSVNNFFKLLETCSKDSGGGFEFHYMCREGVYGYNLIQQRLGELKKMGLEKFCVSPYLLKNGFRPRFENRAMPGVDFERECERHRIVFGVDTSS